MKIRLSKAHIALSIELETKYFLYFIPVFSFTGLSQASDRSVILNIHREKHQSDRTVLWNRAEHFSVTIP